MKMGSLNCCAVLVLLTFISNWIPSNSEDVQTRPVTNALLMDNSVNNYRTVVNSDVLSRDARDTLSDKAIPQSPVASQSSPRVLRSITSGSGRSVQILPTSRSDEVAITAKIANLVSEILEEEGRVSQSTDRDRPELTVTLDDLREPMGSGKDSLSSAPSVKSDRKSDPDVDDIISGIVRLLGGKVNVKVAKPNRPRPRPQHVESSGVSSTRINNRGPPDLALATILPHGLPNNPNRPIEPLQPIPIPRPLDESVGSTSSHVRWPDERPPVSYPYPGIPGYTLNYPVTAIPIPVQIVPDSIHGLVPPEPELPLDFTFATESGDETTFVNDETDAVNKESDSSTLITPTTEVVKEDAAINVELPESSTPPPPPSSTQTTSSVTLTIKKTPIQSAPPSVNSAPESESETVSSVEVSSTFPSSTQVSPSTVTDSFILQTTSPEFTRPHVDLSPSFIPLQDMFSELEGSLQETGESLTFKPLKTDSFSTSTTSVPSSQFITPTPELTSYRPHPPSYSSRPGYVFNEPRPDIITGQVFPEEINRGEIFDITVSAHQGYGGDKPSGKPHIIPVDIEQIRTRPPHRDGIITSPADKDQYVYIDGQKTYINLTPTNAYGIEATQYIGTGGQEHSNGQQHHAGNSRPNTRPNIVRRPDLHRQKLSTRKPFLKRPTSPPVRIDTCIVGDDSTCEANRHEVCRTEYGVSSCNCRPGYARKRPRETCKKVMSLLVSMKVDKLNSDHIGWKAEYRDSQSEEYQRLEWESENGIASVIEHTDLARDYMGCTINNMYHIGGTVVVNATLMLTETNRNKTLVKRELMESMGRAIFSNANRIGDSDLYVVGQQNPVPLIEDLNECNGLHDCSENAHCINVLGSFECQCVSGYTDKFLGEPSKEGRICEACSPGYCHNRGECKVEKGQQLCICRGSYMGVRCEMDGEVLGVALGASLAAAVIIILTLVFLCMWSRRWKREQQKSDLLSGNPASGFTYLSKANLANYRPGIDDRIRWPQYADPISQNIYTQPDTGPTPYMSTGLPSTKSFSGTLSQSITAAQMKSLRNQSRTPVPAMDSSEDDLDDHELLGHNSRTFHLPRPKSRTSYTSQPGMYYDVDFNQPSALYHPQPPIPPIPMATYTQNIRSFYN